MVCYVFPHVNLRSFEHQQTLYMYVCIRKVAAAHCQLPIWLCTTQPGPGRSSVHADNNPTDKKTWVQNTASTPAASLHYLPTMQVL